MALGPSVCPECGAPGGFIGGVCQSCGYSSQPDYAGPLSTAAIGEPSSDIPVRSLADLVTETLLLYRRHFWLFLPIALIPQIPSVLGLASLSVPLDVLVSVGVFVLSSIAQGAIVHSVAAINAGLTPSIDASSRHALRFGAPLVFGQLLWTLLLLGSAVLAVVLIGIPMFFVVLVLFVFYPQAIIIEGSTYLPGFRRSAGLVKGSWWRVLGVELTYILVYAVPVGLLFTLASPQTATVGSIVVAVVGMPWTVIGITLLYFDLRVRNEGFNRDVLSRELQDRSAR